MGYSNRYSEAITITPPLTAPEIRRAPSGQGSSTSWDAHLRINAETVQTEGGETTRYSADAIVGPEETCKGYEVMEQIQTLVDPYGADHEFSGFIQADFDRGLGESPSRYVVRDGRVVEVKGRVEIVWPEDGAE